jgi:hypothetical protein
MRKWVFTLVIALAAPVPLVVGQSADENAALLTPNPADQPNLAEEASTGLKVFLSMRRPGKDIADTAEDAEELEAMTRRKPRIWVRAEYMIWWIKAASFPPLVTSGDFADPIPGALDSVNTNVLLGGTGMDYFDRKGGRFSAGWWLDDEQTWALEASYFFIAGRSINRRFVSPGDPVLATPFFNVNTGSPDSSIVTFPGITSGQVAVDAPSFLQGAEVNVTAALWQTERFRLEGLAGFRYVNLSEGLHITETSLVTLAPQYVALFPFDGNTITVSDSFDTHNHFYGGQIGTRAELYHKRWTLSILTKLAMGVSHETVSIRGFTGIDTQPVTAVNAGLFAVSSNSGQFSRNTFAVVPEVGMNLSFQLTDHLRIFAGYTFLYWSNVARPGDQVDTSVNPNLVPTSMTFGAAGGPVRPTFAFRGTDFFAHGANLGIELKY